MVLKFTPHSPMPWTSIKLLKCVWDLKMYLSFRIQDDPWCTILVVFLNSWFTKLFENLVLKQHNIREWLLKSENRVQVIERWHQTGKIRNILNTSLCTSKNISCRREARQNNKEFRILFYKGKEPVIQPLLQKEWVKLKQSPEIHNMSPHTHPHLFKKKKLSAVNSIVVNITLQPD